MRRLDHLNQLILRSVHRGNRALLVGAAEVERIKLVVPDRKTAAVALGRVGQPETVIARLGNLRHLLGNLGPGRLEQLQHSLSANLVNGQRRQTRQ